MVDPKTPKSPVVVLTKEAIVGNVKTRLGATIGFSNAMHIHFEMCIYIIEFLVDNHIPLVVSLDQQVPNGKINQYCLDNKIRQHFKRRATSGKKLVMK